MSLKKMAKLIGAALCGVLAGAVSAETLDITPRTAVITAFAPEKMAMVALLSDKKTYQLHGAEIIAGTLAGHPVLLAESGVSMVNAALTAQSLIDRFKVERIVFSGIAGGIDPSLHVGDVVVPEEWAEPLESVIMRETADDAKAPQWMEDEMISGLPAYGVIASKKVDTNHEFHQSFKVDPALLETARKVAASLSLNACASDRHCLDQPPHVVVGGVGVSTMSFVDNAKFRDWLYSAWKARATDMESAAVAQVAFVNGVPFIAFRSLSDLAGGETDANRTDLFMTLAAENAASVVKSFIAELPKPDGSRRTQVERQKIL
jgi:adenosylhomocysteine nucleosidase